MAFPHHPALPACGVTSPDLMCQDTRNRLTPHLAEQNAKQADKCSGFQKVTRHFVNQIDFQILKPFFLKEVTESVWEGVESGTVCHCPGWLRGDSDRGRRTTLPVPQASPGEGPSTRLPPGKPPLTSSLSSLRALGAPWLASDPWHTLSTSRNLRHMSVVHPSGFLLIALGVLKVGLDHEPL